jgi:hypothetical protein
VGFSYKTYAKGDPELVPGEEILSWESRSFLPIKGKRFETKTLAKFMHLNNRHVVSLSG